MKAPKFKKGQMVIPINEGDDAYKVLEIAQGVYTYRYTIEISQCITLVFSEDELKEAPKAKPKTKATQSGFMLHTKEKKCHQGEASGFEIT